MTGSSGTKPPVSEPSLPDKVIAIHEALTEAKVPHAFGGALALAYYTELWPTIAIDVNVFAPTNRWSRVIEALEAIGVPVSTLEPLALEEDDQCQLRWGHAAVNLFFAYDPFHDAMRRQIRRVPFSATAIPILAPEHLAVCKAMLDRRKDWLDIEQMLIATDELDLAEVEGWLERMAGKDDSRLQHLAELKAELSEES